MASAELASTLAVIYGSPRVSGGRELRIAVKLRTAEGATLIPVADAIGRQRLLCGKGGSGVFLGAPGRPVAIAERRLVVPPSPFVVGDAEEDLEADIGMLETDPHERNEVLGLEPDREAAVIDGGIAEVADAKAGDAQPVL